MKKIVLALPVLMAIVVFGCCSVEKRPRLELLSSVCIAGGDAINVAMIPNSPFFLVGPDGKQAPATVVKKGEQFVLSDGHHVAYTYIFRSLNEGKIVFEENEHMDTRSMGGTVQDTRRIVIVAPY